jgi:hypothetical protein
MTKRARRLRLIARFDGLRPGNRVSRELAGLLELHGLALLTDTAVEKLAAAVAGSYRFSQKLNRENRARRRVA